VWRLDLSGSLEEFGNSNDGEVALGQAWVITRQISGKCKWRYSPWGDMQSSEELKQLLFLSVWRLVNGWKKILVTKPSGGSLNPTDRPFRDLVGVE
jgi:hypothetical protein